MMMTMIMIMIMTMLMTMMMIILIIIMMIIVDCDFADDSPVWRGLPQWNKTSQELRVRDQNTSRVW